MGKHQLRLVMCAGAAIGLIVVSVLLLDWFTAKALAGPAVFNKLRVDLRTIHIASPDGLTVSQPLSNLRGGFSSAATVTFWSALVFGAIVLYQSGVRLLGGTAPESVSRIGYAFGVLALFSGLGAGFLFAPEGMQLGDLVQISLHRTWSPAMLVVATVLGFLALGLAVAEETADDDAGEYKPVVVATKPPSSPGAPAIARTKTPTGAPPIGALDGRAKTPTGAPTVMERAKRPTGAPMVDVGVRLKSPTGAPPIAAAEPPASRPRLPDEIPFDPSPPDLENAETIALPQQPQVKVATPRPDGLPTGNTPFVSSTPSAVARVAAAITQESLRKKLAYATATATIEEAGLNARREDNFVKLVKWRDIVGVVARRLPAIAPYEGITILDVVSAPGHTLRILPWTKLIGASLEGVGDLRVRALIQLLVLRCPGLHIDPASRAFLTGELPAQLPDETTLEAHDRRLA